MDVEPNVVLAAIIVIIDVPFCVVEDAKALVLDVKVVV
jgi:hypothetical protein